MRKNQCNYTNFGVFAYFLILYTGIGEGTSEVGHAPMNHSSDSAPNIPGENLENNYNDTHVTESPTDSTTEPIHERCPDMVDCQKLSADCINCALNKSCKYGEEMNVTCRPKEGVKCEGADDSGEFMKPFTCLYCYQTAVWQQTCSPTTKCSVKNAPLEYYQSNCTVDEDIICLGKRNFPRMKRCNWSSGRRWTTALVLSITVGGFGADRFFLGHWRQGIGKLFTFGGLGVWTIIDVILIVTGYLGPADSSLYIF